MAGAGQIRAGKAYVEAGLNDSPLVAGLNRASAKLKAWGASVTAAGYDLLKSGLAAGVPLGFSAKEYASFETNMARISTVLHGSGASMEDFRKGIQSMAVEFGESTDTLSKGLYDLLSASVEPGKALDVLRVSVKAATAGVTDTATATKALINILNAFHVPAEKAADVADLLFKVDTRGVTTFAEMAEHIGSITASAYAAGISMEEMAAALATMTRNGLQTDSAVTAMGNIMKEFLKPTDDAAATAAKFGITLNTATIKSMGLLGVMQKLKTAGASAEDFAHIFGDIRGLRGANAIFGDVEGFAADVAAMGNRAGSTERAYAKMANTLTVAFNRAHQAVITIAVAVGEQLSGPLAIASKAIIDLSKGAVAFAQTYGKVIVAVAAGAVALTSAGGALVGLGLALKLASLAVGGLAIGITAITSTVAAVGAVASAVAALLIPVAAVAAVVGSLGVAFFTATRTGQAAAAGIASSWGQAGQYVSTIWGTVSNYLAGAFGTLSDDFARAYQGVSDALTKGDWALAAEIAWTSLKIVFQRGVNEVGKVWNTFGPDIVRVLAIAWGDVLKVTEVLWAGIRTGVIETTTFFIKAWAGAVAKFGDLMNELTNGAGGSVLLGLKYDLGLVSLDEAMAEGLRQTKDYAKNKDKIANDYARDAGKADRDAQADREAEAKRHADAMAGIVAGGAKRAKDAEAASTFNPDAGAKELEALAKKRDALLKQAKGAGGTGPGHIEGPNLPNAPGIAEGMAAAGKVGSIGTFSAVAASLLGGGGYAERTAKASEKNAVLLGDIKKAFQNLTGFRIT